MEPVERHEWTPEELAQRRRRSIAIAIVLALVAVLLFVTTLVRLSGNLAGPTG